MTWIPRLKKAAFLLLCALPLLLASSRAGADVALSFVAVLFVAASALAKDWRWAARPEMRALLLLWGWMLLSSWATPVYPLGAFTSSLIWGRFILFFAAARTWLLDNPQDFKIHNNVALAALALLALAGLWQYHLNGGPYDRLTIPFSHNANVGKYLLTIGLPMLGLAAWRLMESGRQRLLWLPVAGLVVMVATIMISGERSSVLLMLLALGVLGLVLCCAVPRARKLVAFTGAGVTALLVLLAATQPLIQERGQLFIEQMSDFWNTYYGQLYIGAWRLWQQHPLTGVGVQQFLKACNPALLHTSYCDVHPHNLYMDWLASTGTPGIALLLLALFCMGRSLLREVRFSGAAGVLSAFAIAAFVVDVFPLIVTQSPYSNWPAMLYWYSLGLALALPNMGRQQD